MRFKFIQYILFVFAAVAAPIQFYAQSASRMGELTPDAPAAGNSVAYEREAAEESLEASNWYTRPKPQSRFKHFVNSSIGPFTLATEAVSAGITTYRNAPKEWGGKSDGFARRYASNIGKGVIRHGTTYALDEALKLDSRFYRSRDRSVSGRFRNALFSTVTSRDRLGRRVISVPKIAGSVAANVAAAELWYPARYNYVHGLKGGAITLGMDAILNLTKEFVWKKRD